MFIFFRCTECAGRTPRKSVYLWCRRNLYIHRIPEITHTFFVRVLVHPTEVYRDGTSGYVDLQLADMGHPGSPTIPSVLRVSY